MVYSSAPSLLDLCAEGEGYHIYVTELSEKTNETFEEFVARIKGNFFKCERARLEYHSNGKNYELDYSGWFKINKTLQDLDYKRFESEYCISDRIPKRIHVEFKNKTLILENKTNLN